VVERQSIGRIAHEAGHQHRRMGQSSVVSSRLCYSAVPAPQRWQDKFDEPKKDKKVIRQPNRYGQD
jgi:hypothetical protein